MLADVGDPFADTDGDLLPDRLEWVLLLDPQLADSDRDGTDDFLHAVQGRRGLLEPRSNFGYDDEARVVVNSLPDGVGGKSIWVHMLFRFAGANLRDLRSLQPYIDYWGMRIPIDRLIGAGETHLSIRQHPTEGLYVLCSFELGHESTFRWIMPCTIGATTVMGSRTIRTGTFVDSAAGAVTALVPVTPDGGVIQTLTPEDRDDPFWTTSRVCLLRLSVVSTTPSGTLCEVSNADCVSSGELSCPPTCLSSRGQMMFFPDGLSTITGGGR